MTPSREEIVRQLREGLPALAAIDGRERRYAFLDLLRRTLPPKYQPVLVGGSLVEVYTMGGITSLDLDMVGDGPYLRGILLDAGFREDGRAVVHPDLYLIAEFPGRALRPTEASRLVTHGSYQFLAVRPEDSIIDRLCAAVHWDSSTDWEQALLIATTMEGALDWSEIHAAAKPNLVEQAAEELERTVKFWTSP